jgi:hypothetical protein
MPALLVADASSGCGASVMRLTRKIGFGNGRRSPAACDRSSANCFYAIRVTSAPALIPLQCSQDSTRRVLSPAPLTRIEGKAVVEVNGQALHAAFDVGAGSPTRDKVGVDGVVGHMILDVIVQFVKQHRGLQ